MEVTRKVVNRHWWKLLGLKIVLLLVSVSGVLACGVGLFVTIPIGVAALMYAYEDIFAPARKAIPAAGPSGTVVMPATPAGQFGSRFSKPVIAGLAAAAVFVLVVAIVALFQSHRRSRLQQMVFVNEPAAVEEATPTEYVSPAAQNALPIVFGPIIEMTFLPNNPRQRALNLASGQFVTPTQGEFDFGPNGQSTLRAAGVDLYFPRHEPGVATHLTALDWRMLFDAPSGDSNVAVESVESVSPEVMRQQLDNWNNEAWKTNGTAPGMAVLLSGVKNRNLQMHAEDFADSNVKLFVTRDGTAGVLQIVAAEAGSDEMKIRYKLVDQPRAGAGAVSARERKSNHENFLVRLQAASTIMDVDGRSSAVAAVVKDAARAGDADIVKTAVGRIIDSSTRDETAREAALLLARSGQRKAAIEVTRFIMSIDTRDQTLAELAR
jgi:hypothetical protein